MNELLSHLPSPRPLPRQRLLVIVGLLVLLFSGCVDPTTGEPIPPLFAAPSGQALAPAASPAESPAAAPAPALPSADPMSATDEPAIAPTSAPTEESAETDPVPQVAAEPMTDTVTNTVTGTPTNTVTVPATTVTTTVPITDDGAAAPADAVVEISEPPVDDGPPTASILTTRGNIRGGPGTNNPIVAVGQKGDTFTIIAQNEGGGWWQVCCVEGERRAWVAASIVEVTGNTDNLPVSKALFAEDFAATWQVAYTCDSDRCAVAACAGTMSATGRQFVRTTFLEIDRRVEWADGCGDDSYWLHQVDNFTGEERYALAPDSPLFRYWIGALPGPATETITLADGRTVDVICAGPFTQENNEGDGWTSVYTGTTCHDVRTGMIVTMQYDKQWLFSGEFEGQRYTRQFFGDQESYTLTLTETNAELAEEE